MLEHLELENYRGHRLTKIPLTRFTLLVGDNAVGKSSALEAVHLVGQIFDKDKRPEKLFRGKRSLSWLALSGATGAMALRLHGHEDDKPWSLEVTSPDREKTAAMTYSWSLGETRQESLPLDSASLATNPSRPPNEVRHVQSAVVLKLDARRLAAPSTSEEEQPRIEYDGTGLATALQFLKVADLEAFKAFEEAAKRVIPALTEVRFARVRQEETRQRVVTVQTERVQIPETTSFIADELRLQFKGTSPLPAHLASEGTLLAMGLLAFLHLPRCPRVVLLDDVDRALHPRAQAELVARIRRLLEERPTTQVLATTHSPYLADSFTPEEVVVLGRPEDGPVVAQRLADHPDQKLLKSLTTGEFLAASGAGWFGL